MSSRTPQSIQIKDEETVALVEQERVRRGDLELATTARSILRSALRQTAPTANQTPTRNPRRPIRAPK